MKPFAQGRLHFRPRIRLRGLLIAVAILAILLGAYMELVRREERRRRMPSELIAAAESGDVPRIRALLDEGANVDAVSNGRYPWTPLMHASKKGNVDAAELLLERGADPNREDLDFFNALTLAAAEGHWQVVRLLIENGADPARGDGSGKTALDYAQEQAAAEEVEWLERWTSNPAQAVPPPR